VLAQALPAMGLNQNLMGSADCETTSEIVPDSSLPALLNFGPSSPGLGPFLFTMASLA
jgi:hypothetical protein